MLEVERVDTFYGETQALFGATMTIRPGEAVALLGPNGAGKTTMLRSILGLTPARCGVIRFAGKDITRSATHDIARAGIGWVENLSGGEMQMVAIGRALLGGSGLVMLDEPSQGLAPKLVQDVMKTVTRMKRENIAVLIVEQNIKSVLDVCDRVYVIQRGRVIHEGPAASLLQDAATRVALLGA